VWDLDRGVVAATLSASEDQAFLALAISTDDEGEKKYYALVRHGPKLVAQEYLASNNKLVRKIKAGRVNSSDADGGDDSEMAASDAASLIITSSHVVVRAKDYGIRIMEKDSGKKIGKIKVKDSSSSFGEGSSMEMSPCLGNPSVIAALEGTGDAVLYNLDSCKEVARLPADGSASQNAGLQLVDQQSGEEFMLLRNDSLYHIVPGSNRNERITQFSTSNPVALFLKSDEKALALIHQRSSDYKVQWIDFAEDNDEVPAVYKLDEEQDKKGKTTSTPSKKRNASEIKILGPGQAGTDILGSVKKLRANAGDDDDDDDDEMEDAVDNDEEGDENDETKNLTIGERLQMLTDALDDEENEEEDNNDDQNVTAAIAAAVGKTKFKPQKATTESLKELLTQALQSSDDSLLELALSVHDTKIIAMTIKEMHEDLLVILLGKLTSRLASSPLRAESLSIWISHCLKRGSFDSEHLAVLRNMLFERIESFSDLLRLEGRLSMMVD
jgi:hypothetical protein